MLVLMSMLLVSDVLLTVFSLSKAAAVGWAGSGRSFGRAVLASDGAVAGVNSCSCIVEAAQSAFPVILSSR